jgi:hypothetical protein
VAEQVLEEDLQAIREPGDIEAVLQGVEPEDPKGGPADVEGAVGSEGVRWDRASLV